MSLSRRDTLRVVGTALGTALAGCAGPGGNGGEAGTGGAATGAGEGDAAGETTAGDGTETAASPTADETGSGGAAATKTGAAEGTGAGTGTGAAGVTGSVADRSSPDFEFLSHSFYRNDGAVGVQGTLKNVSQKTYTYVEVHATPGNSEENTGGKFYADTKSEGIDKLEPGATWDFELTFDQQDVQNLQRYILWASGRTQS